MSRSDVFLPSEATVLEQTRRWLRKAVIGLELCPFAKPVHAKGQIRYVVSAAETPEALLQHLLLELRDLSVVAAEDVDTTLLIHPWVLTDFLDYNDFLSVVEVALDELDLTGILQVASFHPAYCYEGNELADMANCVTRSPYPMLHVLREASVDRAVAAFPDSASIVNKNIRTLRALGARGWEQLMAEVMSSDPAANEP